MYDSRAQPKTPADLSEGGALEKQDFKVGSKTGTINPMRTTTTWPKAHTDILLKFAHKCLITTTKTKNGATKTTEVFCKEEAEKCWKAAVEADASIPLRTAKDIASKWNVLRRSADGGSALYIEILAEIRGRDPAAVSNLSPSYAERLPRGE